MSYRLSRRADAELEALLRESVDRFGVAQAAKYRTSLERTFERLARSPGTVRPREELASRARAYRHKAHMIV